MENLRQLRAALPFGGEARRYLFEGQTELSGMPGEAVTQINSGYYGKVAERKRLDSASALKER
ncbi:MAG: hypothetical protein ABFC57_15685 [Veillonellales bacterium]